MACNRQEFDPQIKIRVTSLIKSQSKCEIKQNLLNHLYSQEQMGISTHGFLFGGQFFCPKFFGEFAQVSQYLIQESLKAFAAGQKYFGHGNTVGLRETNATIGCICWMIRFSEDHGNYSPHENVVIISACFTVKEMYVLYVAQSPTPHVSKSIFYELLKGRFGSKISNKKIP